MGLQRHVSFSIILWFIFVWHWHAHFFYTSHIYRNIYIYFFFFYKGGHQTLVLPPPSTNVRNYWGPTSQKVFPPLEYRRETQLFFPRTYVLFIYDILSFIYYVFKSVQRSFTHFCFLHLTTDFGLNVETITIKFLNSVYAVYCHAISLTIHFSYLPFPELRWHLGLQGHIDRQIIICTHTHP